MERGKQNRKKQKGQAVIEMALALPWIIWLFFYTINAYQQIKTHHVAQKYAAMNMYQRLRNQAKFNTDRLNTTGEAHGQTFMAVQYMDAASGDVPKRKIIFGPTDVVNIVGTCLEPVGRCSP